jgi:hypothetical protein
MSLTTFVTDIIDKISRHSKKLESASLIANKHWVLISEQGDAKVTYFFRDKDELIIAVNGIVTKGKWEFLSRDSLIISTSEMSILCHISFFDSNVLALTIDGRSGYAFFVNQDFFDKLSSIELLSSFLAKKYLSAALDVALLPEKDSFGKYGYVDSNQNIVIPFKYDLAYEFQEGTAVVARMEYGKLIYGIIDEYGKELIPFFYEYALSFAEDLAVVKRNGKFGYVNRANVCVIDFGFDEANPFKAGKARVKIGNRHHVINRSGQIV